MTIGPEPTRLEPGAAGNRRGGRRAAPGKVRVLFGAFGWPSGMLDVASWAKHAGVAEPVVFQLEPGHAFRLDAEDRSYLVPESFGTPEFRDRLRDWAAGKSLAGRFFKPDGSLAAAVGEALSALGSQFLAKLIELDPHVVGFRLEGGELEQVTQWVRAVRLVCDAEIVLGGPTATSHPREVLRDCGADYVFSGEAAELAELADAELQFTLKLPQRAGALYSAFEVVLERIREARREADHNAASRGGRGSRAAELVRQAESALAQIQDARFQAVDPPGR